MANIVVPRPAVSGETGSSARGVVARYFRIWNDGDTSALGDIIAPDWIDHAHPERRSVEDVGRAVALKKADHPQSRILVDAILGDGNLITVNGRIESDGAIDSRVWIVRVEGGLMREIRAYPAD